MHRIAFHRSDQGYTDGNVITMLTLDFAGARNIVDPGGCGGGCGC